MAAGRFEGYLGGSVGVGLGEGEREGEGAACGRSGLTKVCGLDDKGLDLPS